MVDSLCDGRYHAQGVVRCCLLIVTMVLAGCGTSVGGDVRVTHARISQSAAICSETVSELLTIARHDTFDSPHYARRLLMRGSEESASVLHLAVVRLAHLKEQPSLVLDQFRALARRFSQLATAISQARRKGEIVPHDGYTRYTALSVEAVQACR